MSESNDVVASYEPIGREDLSDPRLLRALWDYLEEVEAAQIPSNVQSALRHDFETDGNIFLYEIRTALHVADVCFVPERMRSVDFERELKDG